MASFATNIHSLPFTTPIPVIMPADLAFPSYRPFAANVDNSRNGEPGSQISSILSLGRSFCLSLCKATDLSLPPFLVSSIFSRSSLTRAKLVSWRVFHVSSFLLIRVVSLAMHYVLNGRRTSIPRLIIVKMNPEALTITSLQHNPWLCPKRLLGLQKMILERS